VDPELALEYVHMARKIGAEHGLRVTVAVHDAAGHPVAVVRGRADTWHGPYMAMGKARLSAAFRKPSDQLIEQWKDRPLFPQSLIDAIPGGVVINPGGHPIFDAGAACVGAIGVGGGTPQLDALVAQLTVEAMAPGMTT
jgi:uncharacterized protein GlcG (DUF336 family)